MGLTEWERSSSEPITSLFICEPAEDGANLSALNDYVQAGRLSAAEVRQAAADAKHPQRLKPGSFLTVHAGLKACSTPA
jgi:hypothetical protein